jgi:tetratricopeptide (TPR) repeat protein
METLKKTLILCLIILSALFSNSQNYTDKIEAFQQSYLHEASGNLAAAIIDLKNVFEESSYEMNLRLGWLHYASGLFTDAQSYYFKAIELKPYAVEARFGIVLPQSAMGNWSSVIHQYEKILEVMPNNTVALHRLGLIYYGQKEYLKAEKYFEKVVNLYPFDYDGLVMYAWSKFQLKNYREAKVLFNKALMHTPSGSSAMEGIQLMEE